MVYSKKKYWALIFILLINIFQAQTGAARKYLLEGDKAYTTESYQDAAANYLRSIQEGEGSFKSNFNLGNAMYKLKKYDDALLQYEKSLSFATDNTEKANAYFNMGDAYFQKRLYEKAAESFKSALKLNPNDENARYNYTLSKQKIEEKQQKQEEQNKKNNSEQEQNNANKKDDLKKDKNNQAEPDNKNDEQGKTDASSNETKKNEDADRNGNKSIKNQEKQSHTSNKSSQSDVYQKSYYENILKAMEEQEKRAHQKIINKRTVRSKGQSNKDW